MKYEKLQRISLFDALNSKSEWEALALAIVSIGLHHNDQAQAEALCLRFAGYADASVRGNALLALGHLARRFGFLDRRECEPTLRAGLVDPSSYVRGHAKAAFGDAVNFLGWDEPVVLASGHDYYLLPPSWVPVFQDESTGLVDELRRETPPGHVLHAALVEAIARRHDRDDVIFRSSHEDGTFFVVHLTWAKETDPNWPHTDTHESVPRLAEALKLDHDWETEAGLE